MTLRAIDPAPFRARYNGPACEVGERPELQWLKIAKLRIDPRYQREIGRRGGDNIVAIAPAFKWAKFAPVVVAPIADGLFAIIDGQHRTTAAALRGFESVPCVIIQVDGAEQADAFVAINANVTAMSPLQLHAARLAAGNSDAADLTEVCRAADVTICRYPVPANKMKPGETLAVGMLQAVLAKFGREVLITALCCITRTRRGNPGMIRKQIVQALCAVLEAESAWLADRDRLIFAMQTFDFAAQFSAAAARSIEAGETVTAILVEAIAAHLDGKVETAPPAAARPAPAAAKSPAAFAAPPAAPKPASPKPPSPRPSGPLAISREEVSFNGLRIRVVPRAALLLQALAKAQPDCVGDEWLIQKIWNVRPNNAGELLDQLVRDLDGLKKLGLEVRSHRGIGRQLVEVTR
ncbi:ParB/RepB/Spo0J family partition protein [Bradyrhizobium sp. 188]|uniref:ParB/RepB/Spo0J family partition protein n=1 Tax=Bradyrhizobium sp. 188 TaxID=2782656 RepID=UPI001FF89826|nr:ParB/RepB/Spo0J family partition protein [Bradyrhizobium sp. 188]MCK1503085.1 ParB N-terminal domain-containing protein [Bradyrhizobium sp. 188]